MREGLLKECFRTQEEGMGHMVVSELEAPGQALRWGLVGRLREDRSEAT